MALTLCVCVLISILNVTIVLAKLFKGNTGYFQFVFYDIFVL